MSIRAIARELYKSQQRVESLQKKYDQSDSANKAAIGVDLQIARKELEMLRRMLDGEKETGEFKKKFDGFGSTKR